MRRICGGGSGVTGCIAHTRQDPEGLRDLWGLAVSVVATARARRATVSRAAGRGTGWRGFALPRLQARNSLLKSGLILGLVVVVWHIPTLFIHGLTGTALMVFVVSFVVALMSFIVVMTWLYNYTGGSLLLATLMHLGFNVALTLSVVPLEMQIAIVAGLHLVFALVVTLVPGSNSTSRGSKRVTEATPGTDCKDAAMCPSWSIVLRQDWNLRPSGY